MEADDVLDLYREYVSPGTAKLLSMSGGDVEVSGLGSRITTSTGEEYLDFNGFGIFTLGHRHPRILAAVQDQLLRNPIATRMLPEQTLATAAQALASVCPGDLRFTFFTQSGAEAIETMMKLSRINGHGHFVAATGSYHGKTLGALSLTGREKYRAPFYPLFDVTFVPFGEIEPLAGVLREHGPQATVILEPVQSEGGVNIPPEGYLQEVARLCREHGALLVSDEVQTGLGRLGAWWGATKAGIEPDMMIVGKPLSGGVVPISGLVATPELYRAFGADPMLHSSTFSGFPLGAAAARATIEVTREEDVPRRAKELGELILGRLREELAPYLGGPVREVRGSGLMLGIEWESSALNGEFSVDLVMERVLTNHTFNAHEVTRITPPVCASEEDIEWFLSAVRRSARTIADRHAAVH